MGQTGSQCYSSVAGNLDGEGIPPSSAELGVPVADVSQLPRWVMGVFPTAECRQEAVNACPSQSENGA